MDIKLSDYNNNILDVFNTDNWADLCECDNVYYICDYPPYSKNHKIIGLVVGSFNKGNSVLIINASNKKYSTLTVESTFRINYEDVDITLIKFNELNYYYRYLLVTDADTNDTYFQNYYYFFNDFDNDETLSYSEDNKIAIYNKEYIIDFETTSNHQNYFADTEIRKIVDIKYYDAVDSNDGGIVIDSANCTFSIFINSDLSISLGNDVTHLFDEIYLIGDDTLVDFKSGEVEQFDNSNDGYITQTIGYRYDFGNTKRYIMLSRNKAYKTLDGKTKYKDVVLLFDTYNWKFVGLYGYTSYEPKWEITDIDGYDISTISVKVGDKYITPDSKETYDMRSEIYLGWGEEFNEYTIDKDGNIRVEFDYSGARESVIENNNVDEIIDDFISENEDYEQKPSEFITYLNDKLYNLYYTNLFDTYDEFVELATGVIDDDKLKQLSDICCL